MVTKAHAQYTVHNKTGPRPRPCSNLSHEDTPRQPAHANGASARNKGRTGGLEDLLPAPGPPQTLEAQPYGR